MKRRRGHPWFWVALLATIVATALVLLTYFTGERLGAVLLELGAFAAGASVCWASPSGRTPRRTLARARVVPRRFNR